MLIFGKSFCEDQSPSSSTHENLYSLLSHFALRPLIAIPLPNTFAIGPATATGKTPHPGDKAEWRKAECATLSRLMKMYQDV